MTPRAAHGATARRTAAIPLRCRKGRIYGLRLDPGIFTNLAFEVHSITINAPRSFFSWFAPTAQYGCWGRRWCRCWRRLC